MSIGHIQYMNQSLEQALQFYALNQIKRPNGSKVMYKKLCTMVQFILLLKIVVPIIIFQLVENRRGRHSQVWASLSERERERSSGLVTAQMFLFSLIFLSYFCALWRGQSSLLMLLLPMAMTSSPLHTIIVSFSVDNKLQVDWAGAIQRH